MRRSLRHRARLISLAVIAAAAIAGVALAVSGDDEQHAPVAGEASPDPAPSPPTEPEAREPEEAEDERREDGEPDPHAHEPPRIDEGELDDAERDVARTVRAYVAALDARDGGGVCELLAPGAIDAVELPRERGGCARSLSASIGYRDPRGLPVWDGARVQGLLTVALDGDRASVTATTVTRFADRDEPSIEDDVIHLRREGGRWLIAKASSTLHRAVGIDDVPPHVLAAPE